MCAVKQVFQKEPEASTSFRVSPSRLSKREHGAVLCYPGTDLKAFDRRVVQLKKLKVRELILEGESKIGKFGVLGKGCVSVVVKARVKGRPDPLALKIRRTDANRPSMQRDYELQKFANSFGIGPGAIAVTNDLFLMEYIDSVKIGRWFAHLKTRMSKRLVRSLVRTILTQCYLLDIHRLDHGELSNPSKHILLKEGGGSDVVIIDYESASTSRKPSNLTSVAQFLLFAGSSGLKMRKILGIEKNSKKKLIKLLRDYKNSPREDSFRNIISFLNIAG